MCMISVILNSVAIIISGCSCPCSCLEILQALPVFVGVWSNT